MNVQYKRCHRGCAFCRCYTAKIPMDTIFQSIYQSRINISDGTIYPILRKLKSEGLVTTYLSEESGGPPRKYYRITDLGRRQYLDDKTEWLNFASEVEKLLKEDGDE